MPAYWVVNLHSSYKLSEQVEVFGLVRNLFDQHYYTYGTFFDTTTTPYLNLTDPRTFLPGIPFAAYVGVRGTLAAGGQAIPRRSAAAGRHQSAARPPSVGPAFISASTAATASAAATGPTA